MELKTRPVKIEYPDVPISEGRFVYYKKRCPVCKSYNVYVRKTLGIVFYLTCRDCKQTKEFIYA